MVAWVVIDRTHSCQTPPSLFPCSHSHFGTHPSLHSAALPLFFSTTYKLPILQVLSFHIHPSNGGYGGYLPFSQHFNLQTSQHSNLPQSISSPLFSYSCALFCT